jgi:acyl dehydratase
VSTHHRELELTEARQRAYSRSGNFHADPDAASALGLPGLVAQGMQVFAPAYGILLDEWGDDFLAHGTVELRFVAMVVAGEVVAAAVTIEDDSANVEVTVTNDDRVAVVGTAKVPRAGERSGP